MQVSNFAITKTVANPLLSRVTGNLDCQNGLKVDTTEATKCNLTRQARLPLWCP